MARRRSAATEARTRPEGVTHAVHFDRIEEDAAGTARAVLLLAEGQTVIVPADLLPSDAAPGMDLSWTLTVDTEATGDLARRTATVRADLKKTDPGGTIHL